MADNISFDDGINDLLFLEKRFRSIMAVVPALREFADLQTAIEQKKAEAEKLSAVLVSVKEDIAAGKAEFTSLVLDNEASVKAAVKEGQEALKKAKDKASQIVSTAEATAKEILSKATLDAEEIYAQVEVADKELLDLNKSIEDQEKVYQDIKSKIAELKSRL